MKSHTEWYDLGPFTIPLGAKLTYGTIKVHFGTHQGLTTTGAERFHTVERLMSENNDEIFFSSKYIVENFNKLLWRWTERIWTERMRI